MSDPNPTARPAEPYRGASEFHYIDQPIFKARKEETARLLQQITIYRGVLLYGSSGAGKSSLINAALIPEAVKLGWRVDRVRIRPQAGGEIRIARISLQDDDQAPYLEGSIAANDSPDQDVVLSIEEFERRLTDAQEPTRLLLFDQFEESITQFLGSPHAPALQDSIVQMLLRFFYSRTLRLKLLLIFREDYLANITQLLEMAPDWVSQFFWLRLPPPQRAREIIEAPFEPVDGEPLFDRRFSPALIDKLACQLMEANPSGLSLTDLQIAALRLWRSPDPEDLLSRRTVAELIEDHLNEALDFLSKEGLRATAIALLDSMVTPFGTRNVISRFDASARAIESENSTQDDCDRAIALLLQLRIIRSEEQREGAYYEIVSEFLAPRIASKKQQRQVEKELQRDQAALAREREMQLAADRSYLQRENRRRQTRALYAIIALIVGGVLVVYNSVRELQYRSTVLNLQAAEQQIRNLQKQNSDAQRTIDLLSSRTRNRTGLRGEKMLGSTILEVALYIVFIYLLLSLVMTGIMEFLAAVLRLREKQLRLTLENLLGDPDIVNKLYTHPLIRSLSPSPVGPPAYLPPRIFGLVLLNLFSRDISSATTVEVAPGSFRSLESLRKRVFELPTQLAASLSVLMSDSRDLDNFRGHLERWFTFAMLSAAASYKRRVQAYLVIIAAMIVVGLNIDAIDMANRISRDSALRASLVAQAQAFAESPATSNPNQAPERIQQNVAALQGLNLPIGLSWGDWTVRRLIGHLPGWIVSMLVLTVAAPFWFDVLSRITSVRFKSRPSDSAWNGPESTGPSKAKLRPKDAPLA